MDQKFRILICNIKTGIQIQTPTNLISIAHKSSTNSKIGRKPMKVTLAELQNKVNEFSIC